MAKTWSLGAAERIIHLRPRALWGATEPWRAPAQKGLLCPHTPLIPLSPCLLGSLSFLEYSWCSSGLCLSTCPCPALHGQPLFLLHCQHGH